MSVISPYATKRRVIGAGVALIALCSGLALSGVVTRTSGANGATTGSILTSVTPYQLSMVHVTLLAPPAAAPSVSADAADVLAEQIFGDPIIETAYATCRMDADVVVQSIPCWAVSLTPPTTGLALGPSPSEMSNPFTFEVLLVNAQDGSEIEGFQAGFPPEPTS